MAKAFFRGKIKAYYGDEGLKRLEAGMPLEADHVGEQGLEHGGEWPLEGDEHQPSLTDVMLMIERQARRQVKKPADDGVLTIGKHIDKWLAGERGRFRAREIQEKSLVSKEQGIKTFRDFVGEDAFGEAQAVEELLSDYRTLLLSKLERGEFKGNTVNDKLKFLRQFIKWCYSQRVLNEMPRVMEDVTKQVRVEKGGQPLEWSDIQRLWEHADDRMRCWIALALNCGFKNRDIAEMRANHITEGRLIAVRHKTKVPMNVKLWPLVLELIEQTREDSSASDRLFVNKEGGPLVRDRSDNLGAAFRLVAQRAGVNATFQQLRDTGAEFVRTWSRKNRISDRRVVQLYLAHKDVSTAQHYLSNDPRDTQADELDQATDAMAEKLRAW